ncbi:hydantoinase B/oxoprolinase family protein [Nocardioides cavernae]|uniref:Hydantoinase B/oxoprolinase family protein n=1 Tax=Nocardioides cavernae TaxID=1921566 RepID=A0ABR8N807_9ACTN|nr:hydantoinase B/oxoprolinase family protein [Nocardioides cavernae]MBD3924267.1 hydantoinase B/oxoprolinase family protein [Nocardioides cavernae]MBM7510794.1 N-methylhydantoinase B [Nocardioides cavernae]
MTEIDQITLQVIGHALTSISREMGVTLSRTSCSPIFNEGNDYSCAVFDAKGQMVSHGEFLPIHLGSMAFATDAVVRAFAEEGLEPGDMVILNDPYIGGTHLPDVTLVAPIFFKDDLLGFAVNRAHHLDIGGTVPGSFFSAAQENYQEGLRIAPIKLVRRGEVDPHLLELIVGNTRLPAQLKVDLAAQMSANRTAIRRLTDLADRYGPDEVQSAMSLILDQSERRTREAIRLLPDGDYEATDYIDNDGITDVPRAVHVTVRIRDDRVEVDFTGSSEQAEGPLNSVLGYTYAGVYMVFQAAMDPDITPNAGCYRAIDIIAPKGTIVNPHFPAACTGGNEVTCIIHNTVFRALAQIPASDEGGPHVMACDHGSSNNMIISGRDPRTDERYVIYEYPEGGWGGNRDRDGLSAIWSIVGNTWNVPVEVVEERFPVRVECYELRPDSGGPGAHRGGLGIRRDHRVLDHDATLSIVANRVRIAPWGLDEGLPGDNARFVINPGTDRERPAAPEFGSKAHGVVLEAGEVISQWTAGGGGWGDPGLRDPESVRHDASEGYVTSETARDVYLVQLDGSGQVDHDATSELRAQRGERARQPQ